MDGVELSRQASHHCPHGAAFEVRRAPAARRVGPHAASLRAFEQAFASGDHLKPDGVASGLSFGELTGAGPLDLTKVGMHDRDAVGDALLERALVHAVEHRLAVLPARRVHQQNVVRGQVRKQSDRRAIVGEQVEHGLSFARQQGADRCGHVAAVSVRGGADRRRGAHAAPPEATGHRSGSPSRSARAARTARRTGRDWPTRSGHSCHRAWPNGYRGARLRFVARASAGRCRRC